MKERRTYTFDYLKGYWWNRIETAIAFTKTVSSLLFYCFDLDLKREENVIKYIIETFKNTFASEC